MSDNCSTGDSKRDESSVIDKALSGRKTEQKYELKSSAFCFGVIDVSLLCNMTGFNIGAFCLRMRENRSVRLQMADFKGFVSFVMFFMKNMD
jgi:hypothetical protein